MKWLSCIITGAATALAGEAMARSVCVGDAHDGNGAIQVVLNRPVEGFPEADVVSWTGRDEEQSRPLSLRVTYRFDRAGLAVVDYVTADAVFGPDRPTAEHPARFELKIGDLMQQGPWDGRFYGAFAGPIEVRPDHMVFAASMRAPPRSGPRRPPIRPEILAAAARGGEAELVIMRDGGEVISQAHWRLPNQVERDRLFRQALKHTNCR